MHRMPLPGRIAPSFAAAAFFTSLALATARAQEKGGQDAALARAVVAAPVTLARGLSAASARGTPISAKFELEDGKPQLSVYTAKRSRYWEVLVDHRTGRVLKAEEIKEGDDLTAAKSQQEAIAKAKRSLSSAVGSAVRANAGFRAVSAIPSVEGGHVVATITLANGTSFKTVTQPLN